MNDLYTDCSGICRKWTLLYKICSRILLGVHLQRVFLV